MSRSIWDARRHMEENRINLTTRNSALFDMKNTVVNIVGCGAIGSFTASALARMNVVNFHLYDMDKVGPENIGVQDFTIYQLNDRKVDAVRQNILSINPMIDISIFPREITEESAWIRTSSYNDGRWNIVVLALDSMEIRKLVTSKIQNSANTCVFDARMGSETMQLYKFIATEGWREEYLKTWYSDEEGDPEPCAARSTSYCSTFAGSIIASEIKKHVTSGISAHEIVFNFPNLMLDSQTDYSSLNS